MKVSLGLGRHIRITYRPNLGTFALGCRRHIAKLHELGPISKHIITEVAKLKGEI